MSTGGWRPGELSGSGSKIGSFGCTANRGQIVRVEWRPAPGERPGPPRNLLVDPCPNCDSRHLTQPTWRKPTERDEGVEPDVVVQGVVPDAADDPRRPWVQRRPLDDGTHR